MGSDLMAALLILPIALCVGVSWRLIRRFSLSAPRRAALLWTIAIVVLPIPAYLLGGAALWIGGVCSEAIGLNFLVGGSIALTLAPPLLYFCALAFCSAMLMARMRRGSRQQIKVR